MREQVEVLEHHADLAAHLVDALEVVGQLDAVDDQRAGLMLLQAVDAAEQRRLAGAGRAADHDPLAAHHPQADALQDVERAEPFVDVDNVDGDLVGARCAPACRMTAFGEVSVTGLPFD